MFEKEKKDENIKEILKKDFGDFFTSNLLEIPDCPEKIFYKGEIFEKSDWKFLTVVGSRNHSAYAKMVIEKIFEELSGYKIVVISGLAIGIDSIAHDVAIKNGLKTMAVPGSGILQDAIYPPSNKGLSEKILQSGGIILSEFEPEEKSRSYFFPKRNRIMAALSDAVLVVEASEKSGTLITARLALDYNKDLCSIPNSIFSNFSEGSNRLLKQGAHPVFSAKEILEIFGIDPENEKRNFQKKLDLNDFTEDEKIILDFLQEPKTKEEIEKNLNLNITKINTTLSILEIKNIISQRLGKFFRK